MEGIIPVNQPPIKDDPSESSWALEVTELLNRLEVLVTSPVLQEDTGNFGALIGDNANAISALNSIVGRTETTGLRAIPADIDHLEHFVGVDLDDYTEYQTDTAYGLSSRISFEGALYRVTEAIAAADNTAFTDLSVVEEMVAAGPIVISDGVRGSEQGELAYARADATQPDINLGNVTADDTSAKGNLATSIGLAAATTVAIETGDRLTSTTGMATAEVTADADVGSTTIEFMYDGPVGTFFDDSEIIAVSRSRADLPRGIYTWEGTEWESIGGGGGDAGPVGTPIAQAITSLTVNNDPTPTTGQIGYTFVAGVEPEVAATPNITSPGPGSILIIDAPGIPVAFPVGTRINGVTSGTSTTVTVAAAAGMQDITLSTNVGFVAGESWTYQLPFNPGIYIWDNDTTTWTLL